ncbi:MAG: laminin sub domain 2, partial [Thermoleophilia bacterium]|nr:laminin sub domain 2 [Thermoleophilia bacterium]
KTATSFDNASNSASVSWTVTPDPAGPTALSVSYPDGDFTGNDVPVTFAQGNDVLSGISEWRLQRAVQPYTNMVCGSGALPVDADYVNVGGASPGSPYSDVGVPNGTCIYYRIRSVDNVGNVTVQSSTDAVQVDQTDPWGQIDAAPAGPIGGTTNAITGLASDGQSGLEHVDVTWTAPGGATGDICLAPGLTAGALPADPSSWACNWNTAATPEDGLYTITLTVEDNAGNVFVTTRQVIVDNLPPAPGALEWVPQTNVTAQYATGSTLYFNPAQTGTVRARIVACDQNGINNVAFPGIAAGWTPAAGNPALVDSIPSNPAVCGVDPGGEFDVTYTFTNPASAPPLPGNVTVVATDSSSNTSTRTGTVIADPTAPTGGSIGYVPQTINVPTTLGINFSVGSDNAGGSGLRGHRLERDTAPLLGNACGAYTGTWTQTGPNNPVAGISDTGLADQTCYRYRLVVTDNVGNQAIYTDPQNDEIKSDRTLPTGTIDVPLAMAMVSGNAVTVSGTSGDVHTAIDHITLDWIGPSGGPLTACAGLTPAPVTGDWTCSWDTIGLIDGQYTLIFTVFDLAGNQNTITRTVVVDNLAPTIGPLQFAEGTNPGYQHANGTRMYFNSLFGGSFDVQVQSSDGGTGVANLTFPSLGGSWGAPAPAVQTVGTPYNSTYTWVAGSPSTAAPVTVTSTDNAGNSSTITFEAIQDATPPVSGTVTYADAWVSGSTQLVGFAVGSDAGSGIRTWKLQRRSATLGAGTCGAYGVWGDIGAADPTAAVLDTGLADATCYQWQLMVVDNVGHEAYFTSTNAVKIDRTAPDGAILPAPPSPWSGTQTISATTTDVGSGVASAALSFTGPMSGSICTEISAPSSFGCTWDTTTVTDGTYVLTLAVRDRANNPNALPIQRTVVVDNNGPTFSFDHFTEGAGALFQFIDTTPVGDDILYVNPGVGASGGFRVHFQATDGGSGMQRVDFPGIGANWAPVGGGPDTDTTDSEFIFDYSWNTGAVEPLVQTATAWDLANNTSTDVFEIRHDTGVPIGGTVNTPNVLTSSAGANITWTPATDALTGMRGHQLQRRSATYALGVCGAFGGWTNIGIVDQPSPFNDTTVLDGNCYQYQLVATDNVSNFAVFSDADAVRIDSTPPTGTIDPAVPAAPWSGTVNVIGTASDSGSGVVDIDLGWISPSTGPLCQDMTAASWTCTFDTTTVPDGTYTFNLVVRDAAG